MMNQNRRQELREYKAEYTADRNRNMIEANETERNLCGQLMLISTVLISGYVIYIGGDKAISLSSHCQKFALIFSLLLLLSSVVSGVFYYFKIISYYEGQAVKLYSAVNKINGILKKDEDNDDEISKLLELEHNANRLWLSFQIVSLLAASIITLVLISSFIYQS